ncbi:CotH kinase family protein [Tumebacillus permanentifrigoris]|uniref:Spore coat protein H n=1 Tax=Tumebacillus permanentifrigoris TaxID=378543 RepID=A0A316DBC0_9BACL|nr:CotH kinase family protein [Tumebacillus permanentifrigoris]PWK14895.1 spore coat protein H [Tumebacillus permanentifrigoris]
MTTNQDLPLYSLFLQPADLRTLLRDPQSEEYVPGRFKSGKQAYRIEACIRGAHTRRYPKKSYSLYFPSQPFQGARELHLNAEYADPSMIRNRLSFAFFEQLGALAPAGQHVRLRLNGSPAGVYLQLESVDDLFLRKRGLPPGPIFYAINDDANFSLLSTITEDVKDDLEDGYEEKVATEEDWASLRQFLYFINASSPADFSRHVEQHVDIESYFNWLLGVVCTQNFDGFVQNYALYQNRQNGRYHLIPWDYDGTWGRNLRGKPLRADFIPITGYNTLTARLLADPILRGRYRQRVEEVLQTLFTTEALEPLVRSLLAAVRPALAQDPHRKQTMEEFEGEYEVILRYISERRSYLLAHLHELK